MKLDRLLLKAEHEKDSEQKKLEKKLAGREKKISDLESELSSIKAESQMSTENKGSTSIRISSANAALSSKS